MTNEAHKDQPPPWMLHAQTFERAGILEVPGPQAHPTILSFFEYTTMKGTAAAKSDETAWCSAFMCAMLEQCGIKSTRSAAARSWKGWGEGLAAPRLGCIVVSERTDPNNPAAAHVALWVGHVDKDHYASLGGNQGNRVCTKPRPYADVIAYRWPIGVP